MSNKNNIYNIMEYRYFRYSRPIPIPRISNDEMGKYEQNVKNSEDILARDEVIKQAKNDKFINDINLYFKTIAHYNEDITLYQLQGLADLREYLNVLVDNITEMEAELNMKNLDSMVYISNYNKKQIEELYSYIYLYTYLHNTTNAKKLVKPIKDIIARLDVPKEND